MKSVDVIIIGAGAAGLRAAREIRHAGLEVMILEARARLGGRICTEKSPMNRVPVELGAEFVHGIATETFFLAKEYGLLMDEISGGHWIQQDGKWVQDSTWEVMSQTMARLRQWCAAHPATDRSFADYAKTDIADAAVRKAVTAFVEGFHASDAAEISVQALARLDEAAERQEEDRAFRLQGGYGALVARLAEELPARCIRPSSLVRRIEWGKGEVLAHVEGVPPFAAKAMIVTVPVSTLQTKAIAFEPPLERKTQALAGLRMGSAARVVVRFARAFWEDRTPNVAMFHAFDATFPTWWTTQPTPSAQLVAWMGGPSATQVSQWSKEELRKAVVTDLAKIFQIAPEALERECRDVRWHDWQTDSLSLGAYSYAAVNGAEAHRQLAAPLPPLFFAGEATESTGDNGTVNGALATGRRAAGEVLDWLRKQS